MLFCFVSAAMDSGGKVGGMVYSEDLFEVIPNARILVLSAERAVAEGTTNDKGRYLIGDIPPGFYTIKAEARGYETAIKETVEILDRSTISIDIGMVRSKPIESTSATLPDGVGGAKLDLLNMPCDPSKIRLAGEKIERAGELRGAALAVGFIGGAIGGILLSQQGDSDSFQEAGAAAFVAGTVISLVLNVSANGRERAGGRLLREACP